MKSGENWSCDFREDIYRLRGFILVYSTGARVYNSQGRVGGRGKILILTKTFYYFNQTL